MKRWVLHILLAAYLVTATEYHELLRVPYLVEHFFDHHQNEGLDFATFLSDHYTHTANQRNQDHEDDHLPFKSCDPVAHSFPAVTGDQQSPDVTIPAVSQIQQLPASTDDTCLPSGIETSVWRPPQA